MTRRLSWLALAAALLFFVAHLPSLVWFLDDIDGINFALGIRSFDVAHHRPHPPGYPIFIVCGKAMTWLFTHIGWHPRGDIEAGAMSLIGIAAGALAAMALVAIFWRIEHNKPRALFAMLLTLAAPLYWFTAARPLSDMPGLAMTLAAQALFAAAFVHQTGWHSRNGTAIEPAEMQASGRLIVLGALVAGLAIGMRSQSAWMTLPLLALVIIDRMGRGAAGAILGSAITGAFGALLWFVPMVIVTGGPAAYFHALGSQASEDFSGVDMLYTSLTSPSSTSSRPLWRLAANLWESFVSPWVSMPLAFIVLALAAVGAIAMAWRSRRGVWLLVGLAVPYAIGHLLFHENETIRYALPLVPAVAYLAIRGVDALTPTRAPWLLPLGAAALIVCSLGVGVPALVAYAPTRPPVFALFQDMSAAETAAEKQGEEAGKERVTPVSLRMPSANGAESEAVTADDGEETPLVAMHRRVLTESRRAREWQGSAFPWSILPAPSQREWLELVRYWREGGHAPIWFIADPRRTDLALIDAASRRFVRHYAWTVERVASDPLSQQLAFSFPKLFQAPALVGGARPDEMDWYLMTPPQWFLAEGWALTPETGGLATQNNKGPGQPDGAVGYVRRRPDAMRLMIGGRNLGAATDPMVRFSLDVDGHVLDTWDVAPNPGFFLKQLPLPAGALNGEGEFAQLTVRATRADGHTGVASAAIEQFDAQPTDAVMVGYDNGWHEREFDPRTGQMWRWTSDAAALRIWNGGHDVHVRLNVESPIRYFSSPPNIVVRVGKQDIKRASPRAEFVIDVDVPAQMLEQAGGFVTLTTDQTFVPAERERGSTDRRRLGLRVFGVTVTPVPR